MIVPSQRRRRAPRRSWLRPLGALAAVVLLLAVGIAIGMSLQDNPTPNLTVTTTKTLLP